MRLRLQVPREFAYRPLSAQQEMHAEAQILLGWHTTLGDSDHEMQHNLVVVCVTWSR